MKSCDAKSICGFNPQMLQCVDKPVYTLADVEKLGQILRKEIRRRTMVR